MKPDVIVVGSGPSGVAAADALVRRGRKVLMLDAGLRMEPERQALVERLAQSEPAAWSAADLARVKEGMTPTAEGIPEKRLFGSDFPYRDSARYADIVCDGTDMKMSLALGGLSNVWGAGAVPYSADDISDWPVGFAALAPFYRECLGQMDLSAETDDLAQYYPLYKERDECRPLRLSRQAAALRRDLEKHRETLRRQGIVFGGARLAVKAPGPTGGDGCLYCGLCMYGCAWGYIYNSADQVRALQANPNFSYQPDVVVNRVEENGTEVRLHARDTTTGAAQIFSASRAFLACGPIATTGILLESLDVWDRPIAMKDSQYFLSPVLRFRSTPGFLEERLTTLAQLFLEVRDPALAERSIHFSIYTYNDMLLTALEHQAGVIGKLFPFLPRALAGRLLVFGGYLHSDESPSIEYSIHRRPDGGRQVRLRGRPNPVSRRIIGRLMMKLARNSFRIGAAPVVPMVRPGLPGRGFRAGGTFPMSVHPGEFESDVAGRPPGFTRLHVVDATIFPSIPSPSMTLTIMANARRIADGVCRE